MSSFISTEDRNTSASVRKTATHEKAASTFSEATNIQMPYDIEISNDESAKTSNKRCGLVEAYAANTNRGLKK